MAGQLDIIETLQSYHGNINVYDPLVDSESSELLTNEPEENCYDAVIVAVLRRQFKELGIAGIGEFSTGKLVIFDVKHIFNSQDLNGGL